MMTKQDQSSDVPRTNRNKKTILTWVGRVLSLLSIAFVVYTIWRMGFDFSFVTNVPLFIVVIIACVGLKLVSLWASASAWSDWLEFFSRVPFSKREARHVYLKANIGKYMPGNVMHFMQRNLFASGMGISQLQLAMASLFEVISYVFVAMLVAVLSAWDNLQMVISRYFGDKLPVLGIVMVCVLVGIAAVLFFLRDKIKKALTGYKISDFLKTLGKVMICQLTALLLLGTVMVLLFQYASSGLSVAQIAMIISTYIVAWVLGYIVPGASGGMGIRETALLLLLGPFMGESLVLALAVIHRLITVIGDFLGYLIVVLRNHERKNDNA